MELKQPRRRRQQKPHKFAYLTMKNSIFARFARAFFSFWHFEDVLVLSTTWNDLFCSCMDDVSIWWQMFNFVFLTPKRWFQFNSRIVRTHFSSIMSLNNWKMIAETRSHIFRWRSRFRRRRVCLSSLIVDVHEISLEMLMETIFNTNDLCSYIILLDQSHIKGLNWTQTLTYDQLQVSLIAQLVEHCTDIAEVRVWVPIGPFIRYCFSNIMHLLITWAEKFRRFDWFRASLFPRNSGITAKIDGITRLPCYTTAAVNAKAVTYKITFIDCFMFISSIDIKRLLRT